MFTCTCSALAALRGLDPAAKYAAFRSFGEGLHGGEYYDCHGLGDVLHPQSLLAYEMNGEPLGALHGAPLRLAVPWKYGFKSGKSLVKIRLVEKPPVTSWVKSAPQEYGFYANVNPNVAHPRWSQATERRIGEDGLFTPKRKTLMFNGYDEVASLYEGMDLRENF